MTTPRRPTDWRHFPQPPRPPEGAPNVLLILTDDVGFGATSTFGGPVPTPTYDALAAQGLRYNRFHTTAMCSPTRAALLTGRNHHAVGTGAIADLALDEPGYTSVIPRTAGSIARVLKDHGYDTGFFGKNHNTPEWETGPMGPFDRWPNGFGFDYFYGFHGKATDQFAPLLVENRNPVDPPADDPDYHLDRDLADRLIHWLRIQNSLRPDNPFFAYLAPGTLHSPHQAPPEWVEKFRGAFDDGWEAMRERTFARQKAMGIIPEDAVLTPRSDWFPAWESIPQDMRPIYARQMEVAAAQLAHNDFQVGRIVEALRRSGQFENTLIIFIQGDNGASLESFYGALNENMALQGCETTPEDLRRAPLEHGGRDTCANYAAPWAWATNTPFQWGKQVASHLGALRDGLVMCWPRRIKHGGAIRTQFHHVIDIAPTIYQAAGLTPPEMLDGVPQQPLDGVSMVYSFDDAEAPSPRTRQYFEMLGYRSMYRDGWMASTTPERPPWHRATTPVDPAAYAWELYDLGADYSQSDNLAARQPDRLSDLRRDFEEEAERFNVEPISAFSLQRVDPANRPSALADCPSFAFYPGPTRYSAHVFPPFERGGRIEAAVQVAAAEANGPVLVKGDVIGGAGLYLSAGRVVYVHNPTSRTEERIVLETAGRLGPGRHEITVTASPVGGEGSRAARLQLAVDGAVEGFAELPVYHVPPGDAFVGRRAVRPLLPGQALEDPEGFVVEEVRIARP
jgi:arylsulfatase